jgi:hypothetical protein
MAEDLSGLSDEELEAQIAEVVARMRPLEGQLAELRAERDVLQTERRRRQRLAQRSRRAELKEAMRSGRLPTFAQLLAGVEGGSFDDYRYHLKTGGEVRLGFPGARRQSVAFTNGRRIVQAQDLTQATELYAAGWEPGAPGRPGVRVHFVGTRQERLVDPEEIHVRPAAEG